MKLIAVPMLLALLGGAAGCASSSSRADEAAAADIAPAPAPIQAAAADARLVEMQTSLTELLERIDVLNDRIARLETTVSESGRQPAMAAAPSTSVPAPAPRARVVEAPPPSMPEPQTAPATQAVAGTSRALLGAQIAEDYRNALMLYGRNKLPEARKAFQNVFDADPAGELADNALYWIGETYFATGNYPEAMRYYTRVTKEYADQNKAPDALFKIGITHAKTGDLQLAKQAFEEVIKRYPYSTSAASSRLELHRIRY